MNCYAPRGLVRDEIARRWIAVNAFRCISVCLLFALATPGCATRGDVELVEAQLRDRQDELARTQAKLARAEREVEIARRDADQLRGQLVSNGEEVVLPEQADTLYRATGIRFNTWLTAALDADGRPGDDVVTAVLTPHDVDGHPVKLPGNLEVTLSNHADGRAIPIRTWRFTAAESRELWQSDLLGGGFRLSLPVDAATAEQVVLLARLRSADGRTFETEHRVDLRKSEALAEGASSPTVPSPVEPSPVERTSARESFSGATFGEREFDEAVSDGPPVDGRDDPNGNGLDRTAPVRTSDVFRFDAGNVPRYR